MHKAGPLSLAILGGSFAALFSATGAPRAAAQSTPTGGPNVTVEVSNVHLVSKRFGSSSCAIDHGCAAAGKRKLLKFTTTIPNIGDEDFVPPSINDTDYELDSCHGHYHYKDFTNYELLSADGTVVETGRKQAFCLMDLQNWGSPDPAVYDCANQGISPGWADVYDHTLDCQWLDVTDVRRGNYLLRVTVNYARVLDPTKGVYETTTADNTVTVPLRIR